MAVDACSEAEWEPDPEGNGVKADNGMMSGVQMRNAADHSQSVLAKQVGGAGTVYSLGMERVGYTLGVHLGLPIPATQLAVIDGKPTSLQQLIHDPRTFRSLQSAPMMGKTIVNEHLFPLAGLFDIWTANTDRHGSNFLFQALPLDKRPAHATSCQFWLIDHGQCGLWPADKFAGRAADAIPESVDDMDGHRLRMEAEQRIALLMPSAYRKALRTAIASDREALLAEIASVEDGVIGEAVYDVPGDFFTPGQAEATIAFLQTRRDNLCKVIGQFWAS